MLSNSALGTYTYGGQYWGAERPHAVLEAGLYSYAYDDNGNQLTKSDEMGPMRTITYDGENRPISVVNRSGTVAYTYGPDGARLKKIVSFGSGTDTTLYLGSNVEIDPSGTYTIHIHSDVKRVANAASSTLHYLHRDHLASVKVVLFVATAAWVSVL